MSNESLKNRIKTAADYQKKAIKALFPEGTKKHLEVIEKELKSMFKEIVTGKTGDKEDEDGQDGSVKKVTID